MKKKEKFKIKDEILNDISRFDRGIKLVQGISESLNIDYSVVHTLCLEMLDEGYLKNEGLVATSDIRHTENFFARISPKGSFLLLSEGGYWERYRKVRRQEIWLATKTIASTLNALAILAIAFFSMLAACNS